MIAQRQDDIYNKTVDMLLDKGTLSKVDQNMILSFATVAYLAEKYKAIGKDPNSRMKTEAYLLALNELNLTENETDKILQ